MIHLAPTIAALLLAASPASPEVADTSRSAGLLGLIPGEKGLLSPLELVKLEAEDARLVATRSEYARRRGLATDGPRDQVRLADWCEAVGLREEAVAHLTAASRQRPEDAGLHERLGERKHRGIWKTEAMIAAESADLKAQSEADDRWAPRLQTWHDALIDPTRRPEAIRGLETVRDPRAVPAVRWSFGDAEAWEQSWAARILGRIDAPKATQELAKLAVFGFEEKVRASALDRIADRDPRTFVGLLINWLREPIRFQAEGPTTSGSDAVLRVEGDRAIIERHYEPFELAPGSGRKAVDDRMGPFRASLAPTAVSRSAEASRRAVVEREGRDVGTLRRINATIERTNARVEAALVRVTGEDLGRSPEPWTIWWTAELGYAYQSPPPPEPKPYVSESVPIAITAPTPPPLPLPVYVPPLVWTGPVRHSCFAAGISVLSRVGPRPIEELKVGDQVLSQDPATGSIDFRPILAVFHNKPTRTLRVAIGPETIRATPIHRFWVAGRGWVMARDLKPGDPIRSVGSTVAVTSVAADEVRPVYNLEVAGGHSFFVGGGHFLVHDNSLVAPTDRAFDRPGPKLAAQAVKSGR